MCEDLKNSENIDKRSVESFGQEWSSFPPWKMSEVERRQYFDDYFHIFPWEALPKDPKGFDMGCGSGRWAALVAPRVGHIDCYDPSEAALAVARRTLAGHRNARFMHGGVDNPDFALETYDFGYSLGVLHHIPDTAAALKNCIRPLKPGAPFLLYLYYRFGNRSWHIKAIWRASELLRAVISRLPHRAKNLVTSFLALVLYWPLARLSWLIERLGFNTHEFPLHSYRNSSFYTMRTDSRDRFGTPLEQRFTKAEIEEMMRAAGLRDITFSDRPPYWTSLGYKA